MPSKNKAIKNKSKKDRKKNSKLSFTTLFLAIFLIYFAYIYTNQSIIISSNKEELVKLEKLIAEEKKLSDQLSDRLERIHTEEEIKKVARQKLGLIKMGERVFVDGNIR